MLVIVWVVAIGMAVSSGKDYGFLMDLSEDFGFL
jgi:hypothetical protein